MVVLSDVLVVKVFNFISGSGGVLELLILFKNFLFLVKKFFEIELILWF